VAKNDVLDAAALAWGASFGFGRYLCAPSTNDAAMDFVNGWVDGARALD
jgi:hypothetical protein